MSICPNINPESKVNAEVFTMMSEIPKSLSKVRPEEINMEVLRAGMIAELDAISLYEQLAVMATNADIRKVLADIAKEEKTHMAEFETMLLRLDREAVQENDKGRKEVEELTGKKKTLNHLYKGLLHSHNR